MKLHISIAVHNLYHITIRKKNILVHEHIYRLNHDKCYLKKKIEDWHCQSYNSIIIRCNSVKKLALKAVAISFLTFTLSLSSYNFCFLFLNFLLKFQFYFYSTHASTWFFLIFLQQFYQILLELHLTFEILLLFQ